MTMSDNAVNGAVHPEPALVTSATPPVEKKLSREDRLEIEVLAVKIHNMVLQQQQMQRDVIESVRQRQAFQTELEAMQAKLSEKYGVDMRTVEIRPDGTLVEKAAQ